MSGMFFMLRLAPEAVNVALLLDSTAPECL